MTTTTSGPEIASAPPTGQQQWAPFPRTSGLAVAALIFGVFPIAGIGAILAIVFGIRARRQIARANGHLTGRGMATAGLVLGWIWMGLFIVGFVAIAVVAALGGVSEKKYTGVPPQTYNPTPTPTTEVRRAPWVVPDGYTKSAPGIAYKLGSKARRPCGAFAACLDMKVITHKSCDKLEASLEINEPDGTLLVQALGGYLNPEVDRPALMSLVFSDLSDPRITNPDNRVVGPTIRCY